jgi:hypothetical protein
MLAHGLDTQATMVVQGLTRSAALAGRCSIYPYPTIVSSTFRYRSIFHTTLEYPSVSDDNGSFAPPCPRWSEVQTLPVKLQQRCLI